MTAFDYDSIDLSALPPETEPARQRYFIARLRRYTEKESAEKETEVSEASAEMTSEPEGEKCTAE